jgi:hypothetical protein
MIEEGHLLVEEAIPFFPATSDAVPVLALAFDDLLG